MCADAGGQHLQQDPCHHIWLYVIISQYKSRHCAQARTQRRHSRSPVGTLQTIEQVWATFCCLSHTCCRLLQVLSEQVIHNESRIAKTRVVVNFNKPRVMQFTWGVRYQDFDQVRRQSAAVIHPGCEPPGQHALPEV